MVGNWFLLSDLDNFAGLHMLVVLSTNSGAGVQARSTHHGLSRCAMRGAKFSMFSPFSHNYHASSNKCHASSNKCLTVVTSATLVVTNSVQSNCASFSLGTGPGKVAPWILHIY